MAKRFWMRWFGGADGDPRPVNYPTPIEWWCTGETLDGTCTICALVEAPTETRAWRHVREYWPEAKESSCQEVEPGWRPSPDRFPPKKKPAESEGRDG